MWLQRANREFDNLEDEAQGSRSARREDWAANSIAEADALEAEAEALRRERLQQRRLSDERASAPNPAARSAKEVSAYGERYVYDESAGRLVHVENEAALDIQRIWRGRKAASDGFTELAERLMAAEIVQVALFTSCLMSITTSA